MCGRYVSATPADELAAYFDVGTVSEALLEPADPNHNVAPTTMVPAVVAKAADPTDRRLETFRWGLVPFWAKDLKIGSRMINARAETVATKNSFRSPFKKRRCIIPADGFYEWWKVGETEKGKPVKQPMYITRVDEAPFAFAGLWSTWTSPDDEEIQSCTIITTSANEACLLYTSPSPRDKRQSRMPSSA